MTSSHCKEKEMHLFLRKCHCKWCHSLDANKIQVKDCKKYTGYHLNTNIAFSDVPILRCGGRKMRRNSFLSKVRWWLLQKFYFFQSRRGIWILFWKQHNFVVITLSNVYFDTAPCCSGCGINSLVNWKIF